MGHILKHQAYTTQLLPSLPPPDPREQAVKLPEDICTACSERRHLHYETTGLEWVGCDGAIKRRHLGMTSDVHDTIVWGEAHPVVTRNLKAALLVACGPAVTAFFNTLGLDEQLHFARKLADVAVSAYLKEQAK